MIRAIVTTADISSSIHGLAERTEAADWLTTVAAQDLLYVAVADLASGAAAAHSARREDGRPRQHQHCHRVLRSARRPTTSPVGWLDVQLSTPADSRIETRTVAGQTCFVIQTPRGTAMLSGDVSPGALEDSAATLETLTE